MLSMKHHCKSRPWAEIEVLNGNWILGGECLADEKVVEDGEADYIGQLMFGYKLFINFCPYCGEKLNPDVQPETSAPHKEDAPYNPYNPEAAYQCQELQKYNSDYPAFGSSKDENGCWFIHQTRGSKTWHLTRYSKHNIPDVPGEIKCSLKFEFGFDILYCPFCGEALDEKRIQQFVSRNSISLLLGFPDPATLATPQFQAAVQRVMASPRAVHALAYGDEQGDRSLIDYLVTRINREQGLALATENLMVTAGSTGAVDMIARLYTQPGGAVMVEAPTYVDALSVFRDHGVELHSVPVDQDGIIIEALENLIKRLSEKRSLPSLLYTIPNFHNPTGITASLPRRLRITQLAQEFGFTIVEDDVYRDIAFDTVVPPSYFALAKGLNVMQVGSFSKTIAPGLRLGWVIASAESIQRFVYSGATQMSGGANPFAAHIVADYCRGGDWDAHLDDLRNRYRLRRDALLAALAEHMPSQVRWTQPSGGFFVWVTLPDDIQASAVKAAASKRGVLVASGEGFFVHPADGAHHLRLTYSFASLPDLKAAARILSEVISG